MPHRLTPQTLRRLTYFLAIADAGSIRGAAQRLGLSVPVISEALSELEEELGSTLAVRNTRRLELTEEGHRIKRVAEDTLSMGDELFDGRDASTPVSGHVALTAPVEIALYWLPPVLDAFRAKHPDVALTLSASDQVANLQNSGFDIALRASFVPPGREDARGPRLPLTLVSAKKCKAVPDDLGWRIDTTLLTPNGVPEILVFDPQTAASKRIVFGDMIRVDNKHVALQMAAQGLGSALVFRAAVQNTPGMEGLVRQAQHLEFGSVRLQFLLRDKHPSRAASALHNMMVNSPCLTP